MKEFKTLSEFEVISAAWYYYIEQCKKYKEAIKENQNNEFFKSLFERRYNKAKEKEEELHSILLEIRTNK